MNVALLRSVLFGVWSVDATTQAATLPIVTKLIKGEEVAFYDVPKSEFTPYAVTTARRSNWYGFKDAQPNSIAVFPVKGIITKEDQYCGPSGTVSLMRNLKEADANDNIIAHILDVDSGGGEATNIASVANFIRAEVQKPVFAWFNGLNASAAYGISVGADEVFAGQSTDVCGSIGVMTTIANWYKYYEAQGLELKDVYSNLSEEKNSIWQQAIDGNLEPLKQKVLDPFAKSFHASVKSMRPNIDEKVLKGATYMAKEAKKLGLIDGQKSWNDMLEYAESKGLKYQKSISKNKNNVNMNNQDILTKAASKLGYQTLEEKDGYVSLKVEDLNKVMETEGTGTAEKTDDKAIEAMESRINALEQRLEAAEKSIEANTTGIKAFGEDTTEKKTTGKATEDPANKNISTSNEEKPLSEWEKYGDSMAKYGITE